MASQTRSVCNTISSAWADSDNAFSEDDLCTSTKGNGDQNVYNFSGNPFTIPGGSVIDGVTVKTVRGGDVNDYYTIELQDTDPSWILKTGTAYLGSCASGLAEILGGAADKWSGNLTQSHINSASFQVRLTYEKTAKANFFYVDHIEVTVYYSESAPVEKNTSDTGSGSDLLLKEREAAVALSGSGVILLLPLKERELSDVGGGSEGLSKFVLAEKFIGDIGGGLDATSLLKVVSKTVSDTANGAMALIRERSMFITETASGLVSLLKERFITVSELGGGEDTAVQAVILGKAVGDVGGGVEVTSKETGEIEKKKKRVWPWQYR